MMAMAKSSESGLVTPTTQHACPSISVLTLRGGTVETGGGAGCGSTAVRLSTPAAYPSSKPCWKAPGRPTRANSTARLVDMRLRQASKPCAYANAIAEPAKDSDDAVVVAVVVVIVVGVAANLATAPSSAAFTAASSAAVAAVAAAALAAQRADENGGERERDLDVERSSAGNSRDTSQRPPAPTNRESISGKSACWCWGSLACVPAIPSGMPCHTR
jgi:hypothetical protein